MGALQLLERPTYLYADVDRLINTPAGTARRWINGYQRAGRDYEPILRDEPEATEWVTWGEFVEARMLAEFRSNKVPTARLRSAVERLRLDYDLPYPLAHLSPYLAVDADLAELTLDAGALDPEDDGLLIVRTGQKILAAARKVMDRATLADDGQGGQFVSEIQADADFPGIKCNPGRLGGQPTFEGRRIQVATVAGMVRSGAASRELAADYGLSLAQVRDAVRYSEKYNLAA